MTGVPVQLAVVAHLEGADPMQRAICAEDKCPEVGVLAAFQCYRVWNNSKGEWKHFSFCSHLCALRAFPPIALGQA